MSKIKLSFISDDLSEQDMEFAKEAGFAGLEVNVHVPLNMVNEDEPLNQLEMKIDHTRKLLDKYNLKVPGMGIWQLNFIDEQTQARCLSYYNRMLKIVHKLGCPILYHGTGRIHNMVEHQQIDRYLRIAPKILEMSEKYGIRSCIYSANILNVAWKTKWWDILFSQLPTLGLKYDPSHLFHEEKPYLEPLSTLLSKYGLRVYHVHIKDVLRINGNTSIEPPAGMGDIQWGKIIALLYSYHYEGYLSLEPHGDWNTNKEMRRLGLTLGKKYLDRFLV
jgi:sugar phosphate isomerase/epimerase